MTTDTTVTDTAVTDGAGTVPAGEWFVRAHVAQLLDNPTDVRGGDRDQASLVEMAGSIRDAGVLQALTVVPVPDTDSERAESESAGVDDADEFGQRPQQFVIYAGHRRRDGARLAAAQVLAEALGYDTAADPALDGLEVDLDDETVRLEAGVQACAAADRLRWLPCLVRPDLAATVGMDIASGLIENDLRAGITGGQRARAAEQLSLAAGWDANRIAAATGLSRANARAAAALPRLGEPARQATYRGELSLEHVAVLDRLAAEGATEDDLGLLARSGTMFDHHVAELGKTLRRRAAADALRDEVDTRGWTLHEEPEGYPLDSPLAPLWALSRAEDPDHTPVLPRHGPEADPTGDRSAAAYAVLPGHGVVLINDPWDEPRLEVVCLDPENNHQGYQRDRRSTLYVEPAVQSETHTEPDSEARVGSGAPTDPDPVVPVRAPQHEQPPASDDGPTAEADAPDESDSSEQEEQARAEAAERAERARVEAAEREEARRVAAAQRAAENERIEAERAAARARRDALETAAGTRWSHVAAMLRTQKGAAGHAELPTVVLARFPWLLGEADYFAEKAEVTAVCAAPDRDARSGAQRWSAGRISHRAVAIAAWLLDQNLTSAVVLERPLVELAEAEPALWWLDYLIAGGYQPAEVETQARATLAEIVTECLAAEYATEPDPAHADPDDGDSDDGDSVDGDSADGDQDSPGRDQSEADTEPA